jgi:hypothetical protein
LRRALWQPVSDPAIEHENWTILLTMLADILKELRDLNSYVRGDDDEEEEEGDG